MRTTYADQPLETSQYYGESGGVCVCCGIQYPGSGRHCQGCQAPLEISETVRERGIPPQFVSVLGDSGSGKTVYLGMLMDMLSKGVLGMKGVAHGTHSVAVQDRTIAALQRRRFPEKTASDADAWQWVHCEVTKQRRNKRPLDLITADFAGEAIAVELEQSGEYPAIRSVVSQSVGVMLLCDSIAATQAPLNEDIFALKLVSYIYGIQKASITSRKDRRIKTPLAIVFTKSDQCPEVEEDPRRFAANNLPRLEQFCQRAFSDFGFFATCVVASTATSMDEYACSSDVAMHVEPRGITEPLDWIMKSC
jgi:Double-GTPase 2